MSLEKIIKHLYSIVLTQISYIYIKNRGMYSAVDIANIFVKKGIDDNSPVTQMKLQKLVFFANGAMLALTDKSKKLVVEPFQAWDYGPVIPEIYSKFKQFGAGEITPEKDLLRLINQGHNFEDIIELDDLSGRVVNDTWKLLRNMNGIQLSEWTHKKDSAWSKVYKQGHNNLLIEDDIVLDFKPLLAKGNV